MLPATPKNTLLRVLIDKVALNIFAANKLLIKNKIMKTTFTLFLLPAIIIFSCAALFSCDKKDSIQHPPAGAKLMKINHWAGSGDGMPYINFDYNVNGKMTAAKATNYTREITYNNDGTVNKIIKTYSNGSAGGVDSIEYASGKITKTYSEKFGNKTKYTLEYNANGKIVKITATDAKNVSAFTSYWEYIWTGDNVTEVKRWNTNNMTPTSSYYEYDTKNNPYYGQYIGEYIFDLMLYGSKNNIIKETYTSNGNPAVINYTLTYNAQNYLETKIISTGGEGLRFFYQ